MPLLIIGAVRCPMDSEHMVNAGISREGRGSAIHMVCAPCSVNIQVKRASPLGRQLVEEARGGATAPAALDDAFGTHAVVPEATEVVEVEPEPAPETEPAVTRPPDGDPYLAGLP